MNVSIYFIYGYNVDANQVIIYNNKQNEKLLDNINLPDDIKCHIISFIDEKEIDSDDEDCENPDEILFYKEDILETFQETIPSEFFTKFFNDEGWFGIMLEHKTYDGYPCSFHINQNYSHILETKYKDKLDKLKNLYLSTFGEPRLLMYVQRQT